MALVYYTYVLVQGSRARVRARARAWQDSVLMTKSLLLHFGQSRTDMVEQLSH